MFSQGAATIGGLPLTRHSDTEFRVIVNGADWSSKVLAQSVRIHDRINGASTMSFEARDDTLGWHPTPGESVFVIYHGDRIFGGTIEEVEEQVPDTSATLFISVTCNNFTKLADRYLVSSSYENVSLFSIVQDIILNKTRLEEDGVQVSEVVNGSLIVEKINFNYRKASDAFRELSEMFGLSWIIDAYRRMVFFDTSTYRAPFDVGDANPIHRGLTLTRTRRSYRNHQIVRAGKDETVSLVDYIHGDSSTDSAEKRTRTFHLKCPFARFESSGAAAPLDKWIKRIGNPNPAVNGFQRVGVQGVDKDNDLDMVDSFGNPSWPQWFYKIDEDKIVQNSESNETLNPTLLPSETLEIHYRGYYRVVVDLEDDEEIRSRQAIEGGSGDYQAVEEDESLDGLNFAMRKAQTLIDRNGRIPAVGQYEVDQFGLFAGHLQTCRFAEHGIAIDHTWIVEEVTIGFICGVRVAPEIRCTVTIIDGETQGGSAEFFRALYNAGRKFVARENEKVEVSRNCIDNVTIEDVLTDSINGSVTVQTWTEDPFTWALVGIYGATEWPTVKEYGWHVGRSRIGRPYGS